MSNILLLFTDMQRFDTIAKLGNTAIKIPNLDRLVRGGTAFTRAYSLHHQYAFLLAGV